MSAEAQSFNVRPSDSEQALVYDKVLNLAGKTATDAWLASKDVAFRQQLDALGDSLAAVRVIDPDLADALDKQYRVGAMALLNREVYFDDGMPELLPRGWARVSDADELALAGLSRNSW